MGIHVANALTGGFCIRLQEFGSNASENKILPSVGANMMELVVDQPFQLE